MAQIISASIDLSKIDKSKIVPGKNGAKYYNFTIKVNDEKDQYGQDVQLKDGQTKEQREAKEQAPFIGNGKTVWKSESIAKSEPKAPEQEIDEGLPF
jgi:hypothetical protein